MNVLLIRLKSIGDVVLTLPAVNAVRENFPGATITFLTSRENVVLLDGFCEVNRVITLDRASLRTVNPLTLIRQFGGLLSQLRAGQFDLVVDFQGYGETAWFTRLTGAPKRWGSVYGRGRGWAYTTGVPRDNMLHHAERSLAILRAGGLEIRAPRNEFFISPAAKVATNNFLQTSRMDTARPILFIQPFTSSPHKNWPLENYLELAQRWQQRGGQVIFGGGPGERATLESVVASRFVISAGVSLSVTAGLMQASTLVIGGDTGALHLAVASGRRVAMLMASTGPGYAYPFQHRNWAITPESGEQVPSMSIARVWAGCERILNEST